MTVAAPPPAVGDRIPTWFSDRPDGLSTVLAVETYRGRFKTAFTHVIRVTAPRTKRGWLEICHGPLQDAAR